ncbi:MAG: BrnA antitoxin family protein [Rickettsiales bacterium]|nr:BrnA antitoxin family protein [Rickettsiales bacterium]
MKNIDKYDNWYPSKKELANLKPITDFPELLESLEKAKKNGRPKLANPKKQVSIRLDIDLLEKFKSLGAGWQTRINEILRAYWA